MQNEISEIIRRSLPANFQSREQHSVQAVATDDRDRVEALQRQRVYRGLIAAHEKFLLQAALRFCRNRFEDAQDLVQDTFVRGYEAYLDGRFAKDSNARAWFMRILINLFLNSRRRDKWASDVDIDTIQRDARLHAAPLDRPDTALWLTTLDEPLQQALDSLSEELRFCTYLVDIEEFTYSEAAVMLAIPVGTVRSRLWRARRMLHTHLLEYAKTHRRI